MNRRMPALVLTSTLSLVGCVHGPAVSASDTLPLRRVVVYRNGVGYFERQGRAADDRLAFRVRESDVGDFLATLAVMERGGSSVRAAAFPAVSDARSPGGRRTVQLSLEGRGHEIAVGYTVETPIWRPSYRVVFEPHGTARLQVWGIVQNRSGEDWNHVRLSLVAGSPVAFRSELGDGSVAPRPTVTDRGEVIESVPGASTSLAQGGDSDGGAIQDAQDVCPDHVEPGDGDTGCPDRDHDRIPDSADRCPLEPETFNGIEDEDGCPDHGQVLVQEGTIRILEAISFEPESDRIPHAAEPMLDAISRALAGNPQLTLVQVEGHTDATERGGDMVASQLLATSRARAVVAALVGRGVTPSRLVTLGSGHAHPLQSDADATGRARNRRVDFHVLATADDPSPRTPTGGRTASATANAPSSLPEATMTPSPRAARSLAEVSGTGGGSRYDLPGEVSVPDGNATMVLLVSRELPGERQFLFAPDPNVAASANHPFQVARFVNRSGGQLEHGPVAMFEAGAFLGQGLLEALPDGATATVPFALERGIAVQSTATHGVEGARLVRIAHDDIVLERYNTDRTTYTVRNGMNHSVRILVRHALPEGVRLASPPEGTEQTDDAALVPVVVSSHAAVTQPLQTQVPFTVHAGWDDDVAADAIEAYLRSGHAAAPQATVLRALLDQRRQIHDRLRERHALDERRADLERSAEETRVNLLTIERNRTAADLRGQLLARLSRTATELDQITRRAVAIDAEVGELRVRLAEGIRTIELEAR